MNKIPVVYFTSLYGCALLVYYEVCPTMKSAIEREKKIKGGSRQGKLNLIITMNPDWRDLFSVLTYFVDVLMHDQAISSREMSG